MLARTLLAGLAAASLVATPLAAADASRSSQPSTADSRLSGESPFVGIAIFAAVIIGALLLSNSEDDNPTSP